MIEYAHRHASEYELVWWLNAEQTAAIADQIRELLPGGTGKVLITTRHNGFGAIGGVVDLDTLDRSEATTLLRRRAPALAQDHAERLAERLGDLPLALDQVAAYLDQTGMPAEEYLQLLGTRTGDLYVRGRPAGHRDTIATVWSLSIRQVRAAAPGALELLRLCAWLAPEPIPLELFTDRAALLPAPLAAVVADQIELADTVGVLAGFCLARRMPDGLLLHRLVQAARASTTPRARWQSSKMAPRCRSC